MWWAYQGLLGVLGAIGVIGTLVVMLSQGMSGALPIFWVLLVWAPFALVYWGYRRYLAAGSAEFLASPSVRDAKYKAWLDRGGIAIDTEAGTIALANGKVSRTYPLSDVRSWRTSLERPGMIVGGGSQAAAMNVMSIAMANRESGLFISVRDIDHPEWRIGMKKKADLVRWMEILEQAIYE